jgi:choline-sulfatase
MDMDPEWPTFMKQLQTVGYRTAVVGKTHFFGPKMRGNPDLRENSDAICSFGFDYALEQFDSQALAFPINTAYKEYLKEKGLLETFIKEIEDKKLRDEKEFDGITSEIPEVHSRLSFTADNAINWLESYEDKQPYFLWVSFVEPHFPFIDYGHWAEFYKDKEIPLGNLEPLSIPDDAYGQYLKRLEDIRYLGHRRKDYILNCARHYYGMISLMDQRIGDIIEAVRDRGEEDNTYLIYTSDHGEMLGQHGLMTKLMFYRPSSLVPTIPIQSRVRVDSPCFQPYKARAQRGISLLVSYPVLWGRITTLSWLPPNVIDTCMIVRMMSSVSFLISRMIPMKIIT